LQQACSPLYYFLISLQLSRLFAGRLWRFLCGADGVCAGRQVNKHVSRLALAAVSTISFVGFLIGPPVIGFIAQLAGLRWSFTLIAVLG